MDRWGMVKEGAMWGGEQGQMLGRGQRQDKTRMLESQQAHPPPAPAPAPSPWPLWPLHTGDAPSAPTSMETPLLPPPATQTRPLLCSSAAGAERARVAS